MIHESGLGRLRMTRQLATRRANVRITGEEPTPGPQEDDANKDAKDRDPDLV